MECINNSTYISGYLFEAEDDLRASQISGHTSYVESAAGGELVPRGGAGGAELFCGGRGQAGEGR